MKVQNKTIVVTGGGNGMGREIVLHLLTKECKVIAVDINEVALQETMHLAGDKKHLLNTEITDITNKTAVEELLQKILSAHGFVDGLINNAGIVQPFKKINDLSLDSIERVFNVNFQGTLLMTKQFLPHLLLRPEAHIINVSSMGGFLPVAGQAIYGASKAAVKIMSESLAVELVNTDVKVTTVFPGAILTNIKANSGLGKEAGINASDVPKDTNLALSPTVAAQIIINAMERNKTRVFVGKDSKTMNLLYRLKPNFATKMIYKKIAHKF